MKLSKDQVKKVAKLARLPLSDKEIDRYSEQLSKILEYVKQLEKVDTKGVEPLFNVTERTNITQIDIVGKCLTQEEALENISNRKNGYFVTKGVFKND